MKIGINFCCVLAILSADALSLNANVTVPDSVAEPGVEQMDTLVVESNGEPEINSLFQLAYIIHSGFISGYQNRYGDNLKPPTNVYHRMTA